jgi:hypothetical protein
VLFVHDIESKEATVSVEGDIGEQLFPICDRCASLPENIQTRPFDSVTLPTAAIEVVFPSTNSWSMKYYQNIVTLLTY